MKAWGQPFEIWLASTGWMSIEQAIGQKGRRWLTS